MRSTFAGKLECRHVVLAELHVVPFLFHPPPGPSQHARSQVDADQAAREPDPLFDQTEIQSASAAQLDDCLARLQIELSPSVLHLPKTEEVNPQNQFPPAMP